MLVAVYRPGIPQEANKLFASILLFAFPFSRSEVKLRLVLLTCHESQEVAGLFYECSHLNRCHRRPESQKSVFRLAFWHLTTLVSFLPWQFDWESVNDLCADVGDNASFRLGHHRSPKSQHPAARKSEKLDEDRRRFFVPAADAKVFAVAQKAELRV